ncbi:MAG TPA: hypothetical protein VMU68_06815 [Acidimicrobiales bacterium]|nr:hypothetical protein [Acidimicrobiales bacterium]
MLMANSRSTVSGLIDAVIFVAGGCFVFFLFGTIGAFLFRRAKFDATPKQVARARATIGAIAVVIALGQMAYKHFHH